MHQAEQARLTNELERDLAQAAADAVPTSAKVQGAAAVLSWIGIANVLVPLALLTMQPTAVAQWLRATVFLLFASGIVALIGFLLVGFRDELRTK